MAGLRHIRDEAYYRRLIERHGSPLLLLDLDVVRRQYRSLHAALPDVELHYALKAWPHPEVIRALAAEGAGFDVASSGEIALLREQGIDPRLCLHTHPIKTDADIRTALRFGITSFVVDNTDELNKLLPYRQRVRALIRVGFRSPEAQVDLARKFGCPPARFLDLLRRALGLEIAVKGISFHVGSQVPSPQAHVQAIENSIELLRRSRSVCGYPLSLLDIGGGFPLDYGSGVMDIEAFCSPIAAALARLPGHIQVYAEPGRFLVGPAAIGVATVVGKAEREGRPWYYLDDGVYNSYSGRIFDHANYPIETFKVPQNKRQSSVLAGPTCDSIDLIAEDIPLPELEIGDLVIGRHLGAYAASTGTRFNSLPPAKILVLNPGPEQSAGWLPNIA